MSVEPFRARAQRGVLFAAAAYNLSFGLWAGFFPTAFFRWLEMEAPRYPAVWSCLGMVIGLYGLAYAWAGRHLDRAKPIVAIGLLGKVLGPLGWLNAVSTGEWPVRTLLLIVFDDVVWWAPFSLILLEGTRAGARVRSLAPWACGALNALAAAATLVLLRPGTEGAGDLATRTRWVADHLTAWRTGWALWMAAAISLVCFYGWWGSRLAARGRALAALGIAVAGLACDLAAESLYAGWLPADFARVERMGLRLTGGAANGLYTVAGIVLTLSTPGLRGLLLAWTWAVWVAGLALVVAAFAGDPTAVVVTTAALLALFCPWTVVLGRRLAAAPPPPASA